MLAWSGRASSVSPPSSSSAFQTSPESFQEASSSRSPSVRATDSSPESAWGVRIWSGIDRRERGTNGGQDVLETESM